MAQVTFYIAVIFVECVIDFCFSSSITKRPDLNISFSFINFIVLIGSGSTNFYSVAPISSSILFEYADPWENDFLDFSDCDVSSMLILDYCLRIYIV